MKRLGEDKKKPVWPIVLVVLFILAILPGFGSGEEEEPKGITLVSAGQGAPSGPRKTFNYDGCRYAFLENGGEYQIPDGMLGKELGTIAGDILADPDTFGKQDLAGTFAVGGTVRVLGKYAPEFRLAVTLDGKNYLADRVGRLDGEPLDMQEFLETADLKRLIHGMSIQDHLGRTEYKTLTTEVSKTMLRNMAKLTPAELTEEAFQAIASAQSKGESYLVVMQLDDGTEYKFYIIPSLKLMMVGDCRYQIPEDFFPLFGGFFDSLPVEPIPVM